MRPKKRRREKKKFMSICKHLIIQGWRTKTFDDKQQRVAIFWIFHIEMSWAFIDFAVPLENKHISIPYCMGFGLPIYYMFHFNDKFILRTKCFICFELCGLVILFGWSKWIIDNFHPTMNDCGRECIRLYLEFSSECSEYMPHKKHKHK